MTYDAGDRQLSRLFEEERRADESAAPALEALLARSPRRRADARDPLAALSLAAAVAGVIAAAALVARSGALREAATASAASGAMQIAEWRSPTAFLLRTPGAELLSEVPTLSALPVPLSSAAGAPPESTKGVER
jgi:hypothetical protein